MSAHNIAEALAKAGKLFEERNEVYGDAYLKVGKIMDALFPDGVMLASAEEQNRYHLIMLIVVKLTRYAPNFKTGGHPDSMDDIMTYAAMVRALDQEGGDENPWA